MRRFCGVSLLLSVLAALATGLSDSEEKTVAKINSDVGVGQNILGAHLRDTREAGQNNKDNGDRPKNKKKKVKKPGKGFKLKNKQIKGKRSRGKQRKGKGQKRVKKSKKKAGKKDSTSRRNRKKTKLHKVKQGKEKKKKHVGRGKKVHNEKNKKKSKSKTKKIATNKKNNQTGLKEKKNKEKNRKVSKGKKKRKKEKNTKRKKDGKKRKVARKNKDKKKTSHEKDRLRKKLKKIKALKKQKKEKSTGKKRNKSRVLPTPVVGNCNNVTCLNNILEVLKFDKDAVQNYMAQKKRMDAGIKLGLGKAGKKAFMNETLSLLISSFGGAAALKRKAPICAGRYNTTKANDGAKVLRNLSDCETKIDAACSVDHKSDTSAALDACNAKFLDFRVQVNLTKDVGALNCTNWDDLKTKLIPALKKCMKGNDTSAETKGKEIKKKMIQCKKIVASCKGWEDQSLSYIATCKTSSSNLKQILFALYKSKDKLNKVSTQIDSALATTTKEGRQKRDLGDCTSLTIAVTQFTLYSSQVQIDTLGSNETIKKVAETITNTKTTTITCTSAEKASITTNQVSIKTIVKACEARITEVMTMLSDLTGTTISQTEIDAIPTIPIVNATAATTTAATTKATTTGAKKTTVKPSTTVIGGTTKGTTTTVAGSTATAGTSLTSGTTAETTTGTTAATTATLSQTTSTASLVSSDSTSSKSPTTSSKSTTLSSKSSTTSSKSTTLSSKSSTISTSSMPDQPDAPTGLQAKNTRLVENSEATNGVTDAIDTLGTSSTRSKRAIWIIKSRTRGIRFIYIYRLMRAFKKALSRTVYSRAALAMSKTILYTISKRNVIPPNSTQKILLVKMKTSLVTMKTTITQYTTVVQQEIVTTNNNGGKPIDTETSVASALQMKYPYSKGVSTLTVMPDNKMNLIRLMRALMANRDGILKITTLITKILTTTSISTSATTIATIIEKAQGVEALSVCLYGREMYHDVVQNLASELVKLVGSSYSVQAVATSTEVTTLTETLSALNTQIVLITKVIMRIHSELIAETGGKFNIQTVSIMIISMEASNFGSIVEQAAVNPPPTTVVVLTASQQEAKLTTTLTELKMVLTNIQMVKTILVKIQTNAMVSGSGTTTSIELLISQFIQIVLLITNEKVTSAEFTELLTQLQAVTKVQTLTASQTVIIVNLIEVVTMIEVTYTGSVSGASMGLIGNKGLLGQEVSATLSFEEQAKAAETQLNTQRSNCAGMDKAAQALDTLVETTTTKFVCADKFDEDCDLMVGDMKTSAANLVSLALQVTKLSAANLEDVQIVEISTQIVQLTSSVTMLTMEQKNTIMSLTLTISSTVLVYVSQISIIESKKFEIGGAIVFPGASTAVIDKNDFAAKKTVLEVQLKNLFKISDSNDKVIECISKIEGLPKSESPKKNKELQKKAKKVPAMCGAPEPPVDDVQETAAEIVKTCATATEQPVEGQLKSLLFIKTSLISFKMTFTSQITVFSQQLSDITGVTVTAATLQTTVILPSGETGVATAVDISEGLEIGSKEFYIVRYQIIKASIIAIGHVLTKITQIISITGDDASGTTSPSNFALLVAQFNAELSSGSVTENLIEIATKILTAKVTSASSKAIIINLNSALSTLNKLQMTCLSDVAVIKQRLVLVLTQAGTSLSKVNFSVKTISETGIVTVVVEAGGASATATAAQLKETSSLIVKSSAALTSVQTLVSSVTILDFSSITTATNEISIRLFMMKLSRFLVLIGTGNTNIEIHTLATELLTYRVTSISEAYITQLNFILSTIVTYRVQVTVEIAIISSQISGGNPGGFSEEKTMATLLIFRNVKGYFSSFNTYMATAMASQNQGCTLSAGDFLQSALKFFTLVTTSNGFSSIATEASTQVKAVQSSLNQVCSFSGKFVLQINGIVSGMTTCIMIIAAQMDTIPKIGTLPPIETTSPGPNDPLVTTAIVTTAISTTTMSAEAMALKIKYIRLCENLNGVNQVMSVMEMACDKSEFAYKDCGNNGGIMGPGQSTSAGPPAGSLTAPKAPTSIFLSLVLGFKTGLTASIEETSSFSTAETIVRSLYDYNFEEFEATDCATLTSYSTNLNTISENIDAEKTDVAAKLEALGITVDPSECRSLEVPPCPHMGCYDCQGCMLEELEGLFTNLKSLETGITALDTAQACTNTVNTITPADFIIILDTLNAVVQLYTPGNLHQGIVKQISTLLVTLSTRTGCPDDAQKEEIQSYIGKLTDMRLMVIVQVTVLQGDFILQCGSTVDPQTIIGDVTPSPISVVLPFDVELEITGSITLLQQILTWTMQIIQILIQIIGGTFVDASGPTCDIFFGYVMEFVTLLIQGDFGPNLEAAWTKVTSVTGISGQCSAQITLQIQIIISALTEASLNIIATITQLFQFLIVSRGLIINMVSFEVQYVTQAEKLAISLNDLRMNCGGVDRVSQQLVLFIQGLEPTPGCTSDEQMEPLMKAIMELLVKSATDIADSSIEEIAGDILTLMNNFEVPCISIKFYARIIMCINILSDTVTTYVSQIALVEQRRLQITGSLSFSISITEVAAQFDFALKTDIKKKQLEGLMLCGSFTDSSAASIETSKQVIEPKGSCSGRTIQKQARKITAMCSSAELPLDDIEENTKELVECASTLDGPLSEGVLWSLEFILITLSSFRVTFSSQIVIIQQSLSILTGQKIIVEEIRPHTEWNLIGMIEPDQETEMILTAEWQDVCFAHSTMGIVMTAMTRVLDIQGSIETSEESFVSSSEFLHSVNSYFTKISIGYVGQEDLYDSALEIITNSRKVSVEAPGRVIFLLKSIMMSIQNYQLSLATDLIIIQKKLIQILNVQVSSLQISFEKLNNEGEVVNIEKGLTCKDKDETYYTEIIEIYNNAIVALKTMCTGVAIAINGTTEETSNLVNTTEYINILSSIVMNLSVDSTNIDQETVDDFTSLSFSSEFSDRQLETLMSIKATLTSYASQLAAEVAMSQSNIQDIKMDQLSPSSSDNEVASGEPPMITMGTPFMVDWGMETDGSTGPGTSDNGMGMGTGGTMDMDSLNMKVDILTSGVTKLIRISELINTTTSECNLESSRAPDAYFDFVFQQFYLVLVTMDMDMENMAMDNMKASIDALGDENQGFLATFTEFNDDGIKCLHGSNEFDIIIVRVVLNVYIEMCQLSLALVQEEILEMTGECPAGFAIGDWSDDSGECCCDPSNQPEDPEESAPTGETPIDVEGSGERPVEVEGSGEQPVEIDGSGEVPVPVDGSGEEPVAVGGSGEEPVAIDSGEVPVDIGGSGQEPVPIGSGEEAVNMGSGEDVVNMGSGEEAVNMGSGEDAVNMGSEEDAVNMGSGPESLGSMISGHGSMSGMMSGHGDMGSMMSGHGDMGSMMSGHGDMDSMMSGHGRWKRQDHNMGNTHSMSSGDTEMSGASGQISVQSSESPYLIGSGYGSGSGQEAVQIGGSGEEAVFMGSGEEPVTIYGQQPIPIDGSGEYPVPIDGSGEQPVPVDGSGEQPIPVDGSGQEPTPVDGSGEQPIPVDESGEQPIPVDETEGPPPEGTMVPPPAPLEGKCYPKKKFCRCRDGPTTEPPTTDGEEPIPIDGSGDGPTTEPPTTDGEEPVPIDGSGEEPVPIDGSGEEPVLIGGSGEEPVLMEGFGSGEEPVSMAPTGGHIPHKLSTTSSTGGPTQTGGFIPHKLTSSTSHQIPHRLTKSTAPVTGFTPFAK